MDMEPVGGRRDGGGPLRTVATLIAPVVVIVLVATAAIAGGSPPPSADPPAPSPGASTAAAAPAEPTDLAILDTAVFPPRVLGLRVRSVKETLELRSAGEIDDRVVAIAGFLTVRPGAVECLEGEAPGTLAEAVGCRRDTILADTDVPVLARQDGDIGWAAPGSTPHLHPQAFPGTSLVDVEALAILPAPPGDDLGPVPVPPVPVVLLGRFGDPRMTDPRANSRHADTGFVLERLVWADGVWQDRPVVRFAPPRSDDLAPEAVREATSEAAPGGTVALGHSLLDLDRLSRIDSSAAGLTRRALEAAGAPTPDRVWYVRVMTRDGLPVDTLAGDTVPRRIGWVVLDADGAALASRTER